MHDLYETGQITAGHMLEVYDMHSSVVNQSRWIQHHIPAKTDSLNDTVILNPYYRGLNVYALGFNIYTDIKRMSQNPTEEDKRLFPDIAGGDWLENVKFAMANFDDAGFIGQYLSPTVARKMKLMQVQSMANGGGSRFKVQEDLSSDESFLKLRKELSHQQEYSSKLPLIEANLRPDHLLRLSYVRNGDRIVDKQSAKQIVSMIESRLWNDKILTDF